jgi:hypothetical protein
LLYFNTQATRRTTTITAPGEVTCIEIKSKALQAASSPCQVSFQKAFMRMLIDRLTQANARLAELGRK